MFSLSSENGNDDPTRNSFDKYYMPLVEIKDFNALIDIKPFFDQPVTNRQEKYERFIEMSKNDDYTTGNLLHFSYHQNYYKHIDIDLSRKTSTIFPQHINFTGKLADDGATMFLITEIQQKTILNFSLDSLILTE